MVIVVAGAGKLAQELLRELPKTASAKVIAWSDAALPAQGCVVVHAGSGRELDAIMAYCRETRSTLVELGTGSAVENRQIDFPVLVCPNTNILMIKFLAMLAESGHHFSSDKLRIIESHQADKSSVPGTAAAIAQSLGLPAGQVVSIRDPQVQRDRLNIPPEHLSRHAYHRIEIEDRDSSIVLETRVLGAAPYAGGVARIIDAIRANPLESRRYDIMEFIERGWI